MIGQMPARSGLLRIRWLIYAALIAFIAVTAVVLIRVFRPEVIVTRLVEGPVIRAVYATGSIAPEREFPLRATNEGTLGKVMVDKGSVVKTGEAVAQIVDPALIYAVDRARAELVEKLARADEKTSPVFAELDARIRATTQQLEIAQREETRMRDAFEAGGGSRTDVDRAVDRTQSAWATLESFKGQRGSKSLELTREVELARSALKTAQWKLDQQTLVCPIATVQSPHHPPSRVACFRAWRRSSALQDSRTK